MNNVKNCSNCRFSVLTTNKDVYKCRKLEQSVYRYDWCNSWKKVPIDIMGNPR